MEQLLYELFYCAIRGYDRRAAEIIETVCNEFNICKKVIDELRMNCNNFNAAVADCCSEITRLENILKNGGML